MKKLSSSERKVINIATIIALAVAALILMQFAAVIMAACIATFVFVPVNKWLIQKLNNTNLATTITVLISVFSFVLPLVLVIWVSIDQIKLMTADINSALSSGNLVTSERLMKLVEKSPIDVSAEELQTFALEAARALGEGFLGILTSSLGSIPRVVTNIILFFYVFVALLGNYEKIFKLLGRLNPLGQDVTDLYIERAGAMTSGMVKGQIVVAIAQGVIGAVSLKIAGLDYFAFFALLLSVLSVIPLGGGIITIPIGVLMLFFGNPWGGLVVLLTHFLIVTNIDNYLRPKLVPKSIELHPALVMISVLSGLAIFGFLGIVVGPVIFILALTTIEMYLKVSNVSPQENL